MLSQGLTYTADRGYTHGRTTFREHADTRREEGVRRMTVRDLRRRAGWTQRELAERLGVSPGAVANWEVGIRTPSLRTAKKIAELFGVLVEDIEFPSSDDVQSSSQATRIA